VGEARSDSSGRSKLRPPRQELQQVRSCTERGPRGFEKLLDSSMSLSRVGLECRRLRGVLGDIRGGKIHTECDRRAVDRVDYHDLLACIELHRALQVDRRGSVLRLSWWRGIGSEFGDRGFGVAAMNFNGP
jgi:hypothetical protein